MAENTPTPLDEMGPVDYLVVEFPAGAQNFSGEMAAELARLSESGAIRILDLLILQKNEDGSIDGVEIDEAGESSGTDDIRRLEADVAEILAAEDVDEVTLTDAHRVCHQRTSGASETIFMNFLSRSSRPTGPKMRVPRGFIWSLISTAAFSSNRM